MPMLIFLAVLGGFAWYIMKPEERERVARPVQRVAARGAKHALIAALAYVSALRARKRWALAVPAAAAVVMIIILMSQLHLRQFADVRPEIEALMAAEERMSSAYASAVEQFKLGAMSGDALAQYITRRIKPELQVVRIRLMSFDRVRAEQEALLTKAKEYVQLRDESWRLRAEALRKRNMAGLKKAESAERASLAALNALEHARKSL
jgi:hypothetical protein